MIEAQTFTIIGTGLIGGSLAKSLMAANVDNKIIAVDANPDACREIATDCTIYAHYNSLCEEAIQPAQCLIIATPPAHWAAIAEQLATFDTSHITLIMDVGSIKQYALECFGSFPAYVAAHPIAGSEFSGAAYAQAGLFANKRVVLCPGDATSDTALTHAIRIWKLLESAPVQMPAALHDRIYAHVSHLPQLCAYAVAHACGEHTHGNHQFMGFARLAGSSPDVWLSIIRHNPSIGEVCETFLQLLCHMIAELREGAVRDESGTPLQMDIAVDVIPRIIASCLISVVSLEEKRSEKAIARFAGSGFADMSAPAMQPPEGDLERISEHTHAVLSLLEMIESSFRTMLLHIKRSEWDALHAHMSHARQTYVHLLN